MGYSSSQTTPTWVFSTGCSPSGKDCSRGSPTQSHSSCQKTCWGTDFSPQATVPVRSLLQQGFPVVHSFLQGISACSGVGSSMVCRKVICSTVDLHELEGDNLCNHGLLHRLQENLCSGAWSTSPLSFADLGVCIVVSITYPPYSSELLLHSIFLPFPK